MALREGIQHALAFHTNAGSAIVSDERDFLRPWCRVMRETRMHYDERLLAFLQKTPTDNFVKELCDVLHMPTSSWFPNNLRPIINKEGVLADITHDLDGTDIESVRTNVHRCMDLYAATLHKLYVVDERLQFNIAKLEDMHKKLDVLELDEDANDVALRTAILTYIHSQYEKLGIEADYTAFCNLYARFCALRTVVFALKTADESTSAPLCTICTTEKVTAALNPCGHVFCNQCAQRQRTQCYICRSSIQDRLRLYFV